MSNKKETTLVVHANPCNTKAAVSVWLDYGNDKYNHVVDNIRITPEYAIDLAKRLITSAMFAGKDSVVYKKLLREAEREIDDMLK